MRQFIQKLQVFMCEITFIPLVLTDYYPFTPFTNPLHDMGQCKQTPSTSSTVPESSLSENASEEDPDTSEEDSE